MNLTTNEKTLLGQMIINLRISQSYLSIFLISSGIIGNLISIMIYSRKIFRETAMGKYLIMQSISDLIFQIYGINQYVFLFYEHLFCQILWSINVGGMICNSLMKTAVSLDRMLLVRFPTKFQVIKKTLFQVCVGVSLVFLAWIPIIIAKNRVKYETMRNNVKLCYVMTDRESQVAVIFTRYYNLIIGHLIPFIVMILSGIVIVKKIFEMKIKSKNVRKNNGKERILAIYTIFCICYYLFMNISYIGILVYQIYFYNPKIFNEPYIFSIEFSQFLKNIEINTSFFLYLFFNKLYRIELMTILRNIQGFLTCGQRNMNGNNSNMEFLSRIKNLNSVV